MSNSLILSKEIVLQDGEKFLLDANLVRSSLGIGGNFTDGEIHKFIMLCYFRKLNAQIGEAYLVKYGKDAQIIVSKDVFLKRIDKHPLCEGYTPGIITIDKKTGEERKRTGTFYNIKNEELVGAWIEIYRKGWKKPFEHSVNLSDYQKFRKNEKGQYVLQSNWKSMAAIMIHKCCTVAGIRNCFPEDFSGMYIEDEIPDSSIEGDFKVLESEQEPETEETINQNQIKALCALARDKELKNDADKLIKFVLEQMIKTGELTSMSKKDIPVSKLEAVRKNVKITLDKMIEKSKKEALKEVEKETSELQEIIIEDEENYIPDEWKDKKEEPKVIQEEIKEHKATETKKKEKKGA